MSEISDEEQQEMREILKKLYPSTSFESKKITTQTYTVIETIITESQKCSGRKDWIVRAGIPFNPMGYVKKEVRKALRRFLLSKNNEIYLSCGKVTANNWRVELELSFE